MTDLIEFSWWGSDNPPTENFKTKKQLSEMGSGRDEVPSTQQTNQSN